MVGYDFRLELINPGTDGKEHLQIAITRDIVRHVPGQQIPYLFRVDAFVTLVEFQIGQHSGTPPKPGIEEDGRNARECERPPLPVTRDALCPDNVRDQIGRIAGKGGGHQRDSRQPPRHRTPGCKKFRGVFSRSFPKGKRRKKAEKKAGRGDDPVNRMKNHSMAARIP